MLLCVVCNDRGKLGWLWHSYSTGASGSLYHRNRFARMDITFQDNAMWLVDRCGGHIDCTPTGEMAVVGGALGPFLWYVPSLNRMEGKRKVYQKWLTLSIWAGEGNMLMLSGKQKAMIRGEGSI